MTGRPLPSASSSVGSASTAAGEGVSLDALRERVHAPEGGREDLDALLAEIDRPLGAGEDPRHRAEQLHRVLADSWLAEFTGSDGRRTDEAATKALGALGAPWAEAPSKEGEAAVPPTPADEEGLPWRYLASVLVLASALYEGASLFDALSLLGLMMAVVGTGPSLVLPALVLLSRPGPHNRLSYGLSTSLALLSILPWALVPLVPVGLLKLLVSGSKAESFQASAIALVLVRAALVACLFIARDTKEART